jgi:uncharacterized protein (DUF2249 family)
MARIDLDVRSLQPPQPFERIVDALDLIGPGDELVVLIHREPRPLFQALRNSGFRWQSELTDEGAFRITIRHGGAARA